MRARSAMCARNLSNGSGLDDVATGAKPKASHAKPPIAINASATINPSTNDFIRTESIERNELVAHHNWRGR